MNDVPKNVVLWIVAVVFTLLLVVYQRATGPTYPVTGKVEIDGNPISYKFLRSYDTGKDAPVLIEVSDKEVSGKFTYKRYKSFDEWTQIEMIKQGGALLAKIPHQPPAGKVEYKVSLFKNGVEYPLTEEPVVIRFKGAVPLAILSPHIFFMFFSLLFGVRAGLEAIFRRKDTLYLAGVALVTIILGGLILGPIVQKYAFDAYWTGWPFGHDLTDNKTAAIFIFWLIAFVKLRKNRQHRTMAIVAMLVMIIVYVIPHSALGSEIDHTKTQTEINE